MRKVALVTLSLLALSLLGCAEKAGEQAAPTTAAAAGPDLTVCTVNYPLAWFAGRIGGDRVRVEFPAPPDGDPAFWTPGPDAVALYQQADLVLLNGAGYAKWTAMAPLPASKLVDTSAAFRDRYIVEEASTTHSHGPGGEHSHGGTAFTTWLDPTLAIEHARAVTEALAKASPGGAGEFQAGFDALERDLLALDGELAGITGGKADLPLLGSHPVYQYLARRYSLNLESVHFEPDEFPGEEAWRGLEKILAHHPAKWMLWEGEPLEETRARLREMGVESVVFDPCGNRPEEGDYLAVMRANASRLGAVYSGP